MPEQLNCVQDTRCVFCQIVAGYGSAEVLHETDETVAFTPLNPATRGHTLVVPHVHAQGVWDISLAMWTKVMADAYTVADILRRDLNPAGMNIIQSTGAAATQTVFHLHVHVVPRYVGDRMGEIWPAPDSAGEHA